MCSVLNPYICIFMYVYTHICLGSAELVGQFAELVSQLSPDSASDLVLSLLAVIFLKSLLNVQFTT